MSVLVFAATALLPADAAEHRTGGRADAARLAELRGELGLDRPAWARYLAWAGGLLRGDVRRPPGEGRAVGYPPETTRFMLAAMRRLRDGRPPRRRPPRPTRTASAIR